MNRDQEIADFLAAHGYGGAAYAPLAADASFRQYFRVATEPPTVLMDAPPEFEEVIPFMAVGAHLAALGFSSPALLASDIARGFLLLEDFGNSTFTRLLAHGEGPGETALYETAVDLLVELHASRPPETLPVKDAPDFVLPRYDDQALLDEASLFLDWYLPLKTGLFATPTQRREFETLWRDVLPRCREGDEVLVMRDYHADNLMWLPGREGTARAGLLDFQDGMAGPCAYDLVSLLLDCRRTVPPALEQAMVARYLAARPELDAQAFRTAYAILGAQRNTKIIGIFTRLWARDGKPAYLELIPRVWALLEQSLKHPALARLKQWFDRTTPAQTRAAPLVDTPPQAMPKKAMLLAAGLGTRMQPLTNTRPKPLIEVGGEALIDHILLRLARAGVGEVVINHHHFSEQIIAHVASRGQVPQITLSDETRQLLETGGGVAKALPALGADPFFVVNGDAIWLNEGEDILHLMARAWDAYRMDFLLMLVPAAHALGYDGAGDFFMAEDGTLTRRGAALAAPYMFGGVQILDPAIFTDIPEGPFSMNVLFDRAIKQGRLCGFVHRGPWLHIGTPQGRDDADAFLSAYHGSLTQPGAET